MRHEPDTTDTMQTTFAQDPTFAAFTAVWPYDLDTGLMTRATFMERGAAELRRAQRYERMLALCTISPLDPAIDDDAFQALALFVQESVRDGVDLVGLLGERTVVVALPETNMLDVMDFAVRLRGQAATLGQPFIADFTTRETIVRDDDKVLATALARCT